MKQWKVTITALEPLSIARGAGTHSSWETGTYIPGSSWRGALAAQWGISPGFEHELTHSLFQSSIFRDAHSTSASLNNADMLFNKKNYETHSLLDSCLKEEKVSMKDKQGNSLLPVDPGWSDEGIFLNRRIGIEISPERNAAKYGQFYSHTSIAEGTVFHTTAVLPEEALHLLSKKEAGVFTVICYIGKKKSAGFGKVRIEIELLEKTKDEKVNLMEKRIEAYSKKLSNDGDWYVQIRSISPLILFDKYLRYTNKLSVDHLTAGYKNKEELAFLLNKKPHISWGMSSVRHGWNSKWNAPKQADWVLNPGTLHVYRFSDLTPEKKEILAALFLFIEETGLGERTNEGFGEVDICGGALEESITKDSGETPTSDKAEKAGNIDFENEYDHDDIRHELIELARSFSKILPAQLGHNQLYALRTFSKEQVVRQILEHDESCYVERRLSRRTENGWKKQIFYNNVSQPTGYHLRDLTENWKVRYGYKKAGEHTIQFLDYLIGERKILKESEQEK